MACYIVGAMNGAGYDLQTSVIMGFIITAAVIVLGEIMPVKRDAKSTLKPRLLKWGFALDRQPAENRRLFLRLLYVQSRLWLEVSGKNSPALNLICWGFWTMLPVSPISTYTPLLGAFGPAGIDAAVPFASLPFTIRLPQFLKNMSILSLHLFALCSLMRKAFWKLKRTACTFRLLKGHHNLWETEEYHGFLVLIKYILLGLLQGFTEPIPVSSSGHLVLAQHFWAWILKASVLSFWWMPVL